MGRDLKNTAIYTAFDDLPPIDPATPEKNLLRAILMSALSDVRKSGEAGVKAREYLLSSEEDYIFSFRSICTYLNVDPTRILVVTGVEDQPEEEEERSDTQRPAA